MPQFDIITFLNQILWLFVFFFGTYFIMLKYFLPEVARLLKIREKKIVLNSKNFLQSTEEILLNKKNLNTILLLFFNYCFVSINASVNQLQVWLKQNIKFPLTFLKSFELKIIKNLYYLVFVDHLQISVSSINVVPKNVSFMNYQIKKNFKNFFKQFQNKSFASLETKSIKKVGGKSSKKKKKK